MIRKFLYFTLLLTVLIHCSSDNVRNKNPFVPNYSFSITIDTNLPSYSGLASPVNPQLITLPNIGANGIIVMKVSDTDYRAWEANCPNQSITSCSRMTLVGTNAKCPCDDIEYSLFTGVSATGGAQYTLIPYRIEVVSNRVIRVYN